MNRRDFISSAAMAGVTAWAFRFHPWRRPYWPLSKSESLAWIHRTLLRLQNILM